MFPLDAEAAGHAAATRLDELELQAGDGLEHLAHGLHRPRRLLVTVAVHLQGLAAGVDRFEGQGEAFGGDLSGDELLEQQGLAGHRAGLLTQTQSPVIFPQGRQAGGFQTDDAKADGWPLYPGMGFLQARYVLVVSLLCERTLSRTLWHGGINHDRTQRNRGPFQTL